MATRNAISRDVVPLLNSVHITTALKPKTDPTERSNSPAVMSRVMAKRDQPELHREGQDVADVEQRHEVGVDGREHDEQHDEQHEGPELRARHEPPEEACRGASGRVSVRARGGRRGAHLDRRRRMWTPGV